MNAGGIQHLRQTPLPRVVTAKSLSGGDGQALATLGIVQQRGDSLTRRLALFRQPRL